jgi:outer membrane protein assembly factor BamB
VTNRYDNARTGANTSETILTKSNVANLALLFSDSINGYVYGQPLYVSGLHVGGAAHNVVYVATSQNMVYAFDADATGAPLWSKQLETPVPTNTIGGSCGDMVANVVGITSTPVISLQESRIYVVARTSGANHLHAFDLATGTEAAGSPVTIGTGTAGYTADLELNRPGLLLLNGVVYSAYGSNCDNGKYHGFIFGHDAHTLAQTIAYNTTPGATDLAGAIWQSGMGLASDGTTIWMAVGNGTGGQSWQVAQLTPMGNTLVVGAHHQEAPNGDEDLCAGPVLVGNQVLAGGKSATFFMLNASDASLATRLSLEGEVHNIATWNGGTAGQMVYAWGDASPLHQYAITSGMLVAKGTNGEQLPGHPGGMITVSSNGTAADSGIVWGLVPLCPGTGKTACKGALYAWDATDITKASLWNSTKNAADALGNYAKYSPPTVANGKVYAASWSGKLMVYGLH